MLERRHASFSSLETPPVNWVRHLASAASCSPPHSRSNHLSYKMKTYTPSSQKNTKNGTNCLLGFLEVVFYWGIDRGALLKSLVFISDLCLRSRSKECSKRPTQEHRHILCSNFQTHSYIRRWFTQHNYHLVWYCRKLHPSITSINMYIYIGGRKDYKKIPENIYTVIFWELSEEHFCNYYKINCLEKYFL